MSAALIVFISDFGLQDAYVGIVKGVISGISPRTNVIDLTHEIPPGDIRRAAVMLWQSEPYFPPGTIFLGVVDPGVGSARKAIICRTARGLFVGPDNGLVSYLWKDLRMQKWEIDQTTNSKGLSSNTFHGRDLFAPVAAKLANGMAVESFGPLVENILTLEPPVLSIEKNVIRGEVLFSDHFGNIVTSIGRFVKTSQPEKWKMAGWWSGFPEISIDLLSARLTIDEGMEISFVDTFADIPPGSIRALVGGSGLIEIVANRASAASMMTTNPGEMITLTITQ